MRPYIICHMLSSVDGKIDGASSAACHSGSRQGATRGRQQVDHGRIVVNLNLAADLADRLEAFGAVTGRPALGNSDFPKAGEHKRVGAPVGLMAPLGVDEDFPMKEVVPRQGFEPWTN